MGMKQREVILNKRIVTSLLAGVLLGSAFYAQPAAAGEVINITTDQTSDVKPNSSSTYNIVTVGSDGGGNASPKIQGSVYGAKADYEAASEGNQVIIKSGEITGKVYGANGGEGLLTNNKVVISGGTIKDDVEGAHTYSSVTTYNSVTVDGGTIKGNVRGGFVYSGEGKASEYNEVTVNGGKIGGSVYGVYNDGGPVIHNKVTINGGEVTGNVYGGYGENAGGAMENSVIITGGTITGNVYGGYHSHDKDVTNNIVTISGRPTFADDTVIYGGYSNSGEVSGNILNIKNTDITVSNIKNFDVYNFYLPNTVQAGDVLLTVTGGSGNEQTDLKGSTVNVGIAGSAPALQSGDNVTLLHNANGVLADATTVYGKITQGVSLEYDFTTVLENGDSLVTTITRIGISDDTKSLVETQAAAVGFINSGADLLAGSGIGSMTAVTSAEDGTIFGAMSGGSMRYDTGSHADVKGYNFALGMGKAVANNAGKLTFGSLLEYGYGNYTSYLDNGIRADGNTKYYGIGLLARQDNKSGVYYEGSLRYGRMDADYGSNDLGTAGVHSSYDSSSAYYGAHLGIGKVTELNDTTKADVYAKLLYTHQNGDSVTLQGEGNGEVYDFDAVDSTRVRVGARVSKAYSERGTGYVGLAYEYEFDGEARATVKGFSTPSPSIKGSSGLLELGYILQPKGANDPMVNIGLQGWGGRKQGFSGSVNFVWKF